MDNRCWMERKSFWKSKEFVARNILDLINKEAASNAYISVKTKIAVCLLKG